MIAAQLILALQTITSREKSPFDLSIKMAPDDSVPGGNAKITISAMREPGFDGEITISSPAGLPAAMPAVKSVPPIAKGKNAIENESPGKRRFAVVID